jgi:hypothetical protein
MIRSKQWQLQCQPLSVLPNEYLKKSVGWPEESRYTSVMDIFQEIKNAFQIKQESLKNLLAEGQAEDYNQYKQIVGTLSGIEWAYTELNRIVNNRMENDLDND